MKRVTISLCDDKSIDISPCILSQVVRDKRRKARRDAMARAMMRGIGVVCISIASISVMILSII